MSGKDEDVLVEDEDVSVAIEDVSVTGGGGELSGAVLNQLVAEQRRSEVDEEQVKQILIIQE